MQHITSNRLNISAYDPYELWEHYTIDQYVFHYNLLVADKDTVTKYAYRWQGKESLLNQISNEIHIHSYDWSSKFDGVKITDEKDARLQIPDQEEIENLGSAQQTKFLHDLRGVKIHDSEINESLHGLEYTRLDYSLIEKTKFIRIEKERKQEEFIGFFGMSFNHCRFSQCHFENFAFRSGEFKHVVFYDCKFKKMFFNRNHDGVYSHIFFQNCHFEDVDFAALDIRTFCFLGNCTFSKIKLNHALGYERMLGRDIRETIAKYDKSTYEFRKSIQGTTYEGKKAPRFFYYDQGEKIPKKLKLFFSSIIYEGLFHFYHEYANALELKGEYHMSILFQFHAAYCKDEIKKEHKGEKKRATIWINRQVFGYGYKYEKTLSFLFIITVLASVAYLFTGIDYNGHEINRTFDFNMSELFPTLHDWLRCLYFSLKSTTNVGQGNIIPTSVYSIILSFTQGVLGIIAFTIFVVIFSKRFFKS